MKTTTVRTIAYGGRTYVAEVTVCDEPGMRYVGVKLPGALSHLAGALAWKVGEEEHGWRMGNGSSHGIGSGHARTINLETGNGRVYAIEWAH